MKQQQQHCRLDLQRPARPPEVDNGVPPLGWIKAHTGALDPKVSKHISASVAQRQAEIFH